MGWGNRSLKTGGTKWTADADDVHLTAAARVYVNSAAFGGAVVCKLKNSPRSLG